MKFAAAAAATAASLAFVGAQEAPPRRLLAPLPSMSYGPDLMAADSKGSAKSGKSKSDKSGGSSKSGKGRGDYLDYAEGLIREMTDTICGNGALVGMCTGIQTLAALGMKYQSLPRWYYVNYQAMTVAYPLVGAFIRGEAMPLGIGLADPLRPHRVLGLANAYRMQGYDEEAVNDMYWTYSDLLTIQDWNSGPPLDGLEQYCTYISKEYETLKAFAVDNFNTTALEQSPTWNLPVPGDVTSGGFYGLCAAPIDVLAYVSRNDWEHHRAEVVGSMMDTSMTEEFVLYTLWHWESLVAGGSDAIPFLLQSFDVFLN